MDLSDVAVGVVCFGLGSLAMFLANRGTKTRAEAIKAEKEYLGRKLDEANAWIRDKFGNGAGPKP